MKKGNIHVQKLMPKTKKYYGNENNKTSENI